MNRILRCGRISGLRLMALVAVVVVLAGCGVYTFSGSTLPSHLKTVDMPLFGNESLEPDLAELLTAKLNEEVLSSNLLRIVGSDADASISGTVLSYTNHPYTYGSQEYRNVNVTQYAVRIRVDVLFMDNTENTPLYKGVVSGEGIYNLDTETEDMGKQRALEEVIEQILQNSVQSW